VLIYGRLEHGFRRYKWWVCWARFAPPICEGGNGRNNYAQMGTRRVCGRAKRRWSALQREQGGCHALREELRTFVVERDFQGIIDGWRIDSIELHSEEEGVMSKCRCIVEIWIFAGLGVMVFSSVLMREWPDYILRRGAARGAHRVSPGRDSRCQVAARWWLPMCRSAKICRGN